MTKCLLCDKEGKPSNGLTVLVYVCEEHYKTLKELENQNKKRYERTFRKIRRTETGN